MIEWGSFLLVAGVSIGSAAVLVAVFAAGLRLLATEPVSWWLRASAVGCFVLAAAGALFGIYLLIPSLHAH